MDRGLDDLAKDFHTRGQGLSGVIECSNGGPNLLRCGDVESSMPRLSNRGGLDSTIEQILRHQSIVPGADSSSECTWLMGATV